jgi:hypothetical protein
MAMETFRFIREYESDKQAAASREEVNLLVFAIKCRNGFVLVNLKNQTTKPISTLKEVLKYTSDIR